MNLIKLLKKISRPLREKITGKIANNEGFVGDVAYWINKKISKFIGVCERIYEVVLFIPVVYRVVRWDYSSLFIILHHWLSRMQEVHETDTVHLNSSRYARQIKICTKLLKRIIDETHEETLFDDLEKEFGPYNSFSYIPLSREKITTPEQQKIYRDKVSNGYIMIEKKYNKDCEVLFRIIKKYHRNWWS